MTHPRHQMTTNGVEIKVTRFMEWDSHVKTLRKLTAGRMTLAAPLAARPDSTVTLTGPDGSVTELTDPEAVTEALREITDQSTVQVFALVVHATGGESYHVVPRPHLPIFHVNTYHRR